MSLRPGSVSITTSASSRPASKSWQIGSGGGDGGVGRTNRMLMPASLERFRASWRTNLRRSVGVVQNLRQLQLVTALAVTQF